MPVRVEHEEAAETAAVTGESVPSWYLTVRASPVDQSLQGSFSLLFSPTSSGAAD